MKHNSKLNRSRWLLLTLFTLIVGVSPAWGETLTANFNTNNTYPSGWSYFGSISFDDARRRGSTGYGLATSAKNASANYIITEEIEGTLTLYWRSYGTSSSYPNGYITLYKYDGSALGDAIKTTDGYKSSTFKSESFNLGDYKGQVAIGLYSAAIDDVTYTQKEAAEGPALVIKDGSTKITTGYAFNFGLATAGTTKTFTLTNPGTEGVEGLSVSETGSFDATLSATSIAAGGQTTLTITMPSTTGSSTITISSTTEGIDDFVINASGTIRDPNKVYLNFSDSQIPDGWTSVMTGSYGYPWTPTSGYIYQSGSASSYSWAFSSPKLVFAKDEVIMFKTARYLNKDYYDNPRTCSIVVEYSLDGSSFTPIGSAFTDDAYNEWTQRSVTIPVEGVNYIRFNGYDICLTEIYGGQLPLNPAPKDLAYSNVTNASAQLSWTSTAANFNIQYKTTSAGEWTTIENITANPYTLTGLDAETEYQVKVQADHGVYGLSDYTDPVSFTTKTNPISSYPYTENFNNLSSNGQIPAYWDNSEGTTTEATYKWSYNSSYGTGHEGKCIRFDSYSNNSGRTNFLKTRPFNFTEGTPMRISFWYKNPTGGDFSVYASTDGGTTYPTELATGLTGKSDWTQKEINIPASVYGNNVVIVFKGTSNYGSGDARIYLDDVEISEVSNYSMSISGGDVSENTIAFGTVKNTTTTKTFTINNDGGDALTGISVVSSDNTVFTVSDTGFDLASGATKDITVTFVKATEADYSETITISQTNVSPVVLTATATYVAPTPATIAVKLNDVAVGASVPFGTVGKAKTKTFTVSNTGEATLNITSIESSNTTDFTVSPASLDVAGGETGEFTVTFVWDGEALNAEKTADITLTNNAGDPVVFAVTGTRDDFWSEDFEGVNPLNGWENNGFTVKNQAYLGSTNNGTTLPSKFAVSNYSATASTLITPCLEATAGDKLSFDAYFAWGDETLKVEWSEDKENWHTDAPLYNYDKSSYSNGEYHTIEITAPITGAFYLRFSATFSNAIDNIEGFKLNENAPVIAVFSDAEATASVTSGTTKDFGWAKTAQSATYYITNSGTGTLTISEISAVDGFTAATAGDVMTVAAGADPLALTVTMTNAAVGAKSGTFTITTDGGNFEIPVKGFVYGDRNLVDFTDASQYQGWTGVNVTDNAATLSSTAIETTPFAATAAEPLYVEIKGNSSYTTHSFSYSYSRDGGVNWSEATALVASTTNAVPDQVFTITDIADAEAASTVLIRFTGAGLGINHIYGFEALTAPIMTLDKTADYNFGMQTAAAEYVITVTNTGTATLNNLAAALTTGTNYTVAITKPDGESTTTISAGKATVPAGQQAIITVTQLFDANNGLASLSDVLTISGDDVASQVINLSGQTRDGSKWYVDFASGIPSSFIQTGNWSTTSQQGYVYSESALVSQTLTIAANEKVQFDAKQYSSYYAGIAVLKVRHSVNGGLTWSDYTDLTGELGLDYTTLQYSVGNTDASAVAMIEFLGAYVNLDNIYGGTLNNDAPMIQVKKGSSVVESGVAEAFGTILAEASAEYTIKNIGGGTLTITSPVSVTGVATATVSETSLTNNESATLIITMPVEAPYGDKAGVVTVETSLGDFVINYTATTKNPNTLNATFDDYALPAGWYNNGWSCAYSQYMSRTDRNSDTDFITQKLQVADTSDALKFDAQKYGSYYASSTVLKVSYSTDRVNWTEIGDYASEMTTSWKTFEISGLEAGEYYLKFTGRYANVDNIIGWEKVAGIEHDLYVTATSFPTTTDKGYDATITATVTSLRAAETGVYAKLFINGVQEGDPSATQDIALNGTNTFEFTYAIPEKKTAQIKVYYSGDTEAFATAVNIMKVNYTMDETSTPEAFDAGIYDVKLTYTKDAEKLGTICLPFATTTEELSEAYGTTVKIYELTGRAENVITFNGVDELTAGTPYLIYSDEALSGKKSFEDKTVVAAAGNSEASSVTFQGIYAPTTAGNWGAEWYGVTSEGKIAKGTETTTMKGLRAYFTGNVADARIFIMDDEGTTRIATINRGGVAIDDAAVYNLNGQKVQNAKKGLYIVNGRKVVIK